MDEPSKMYIQSKPLIATVLLSREYGDINFPTLGYGVSSKVCHI
jgi:hypothetical protein